MKPFSVVLVFTLFPALVKVAKAFVGANGLLETYSAWVARLKTKPGKRAHAVWCLFFYQPVVLVILLAACLFWFSAPQDSSFSFYWDRGLASASVVLATAVFLCSLWATFNPEMIKRPAKPRMRTRSRSELGY